MSKLNILNVVGTLALTAILAIIGTLTYIEDRPKITATGEYSAWTLPTEVSDESYRIIPRESENFSSTTKFFVNGVSSYLLLDIRNAGNTEAKEVRLILPIDDGIYELDNSDKAHSFANEINIGDLNPGEGTVIRIWSRSYRDIRHGDVIVTHTRGKEIIDLGYSTTGILASFLRNSFIIFTIAPILLMMVFGLAYDLLIKRRATINKKE